MLHNVVHVGKGLATQTLHNVLTQRYARWHGVHMKHTHALLTSGEACDHLGIDRSTLSRWVTTGRVHATKLPGLRGAYLFTRTEIDRMKAEVDSA